MTPAPLGRDSQLGAKAKAKLNPRANPKTGSPVARPGVGELQSKILESMLEQVDAGNCLTVFDVGVAVPETVDFFAQTRCRLFFTDLFSESFIRQQQPETAEPDLVESFQKAMNFPPGTRIDICLFWDFLNYLDVPALRAFNEALRPFVHKGTLAHGFSLLNARTTLLNQQYGLAAEDLIVVRPRGEEQLAPHQHSLSELQRSFCGFDVNRSTLMSDGRMEVLLHSVG